ncbi:MAG: putative salt-induced outer membrane protein YdiY [Bermanella sp.]|jgi:putative salt-induced outer membrane protein YdiY
MIHIKTVALSLLVTSITSVNVKAVEPVAAEKSTAPVNGLHVETELGVILTTGNTKTSSYKAKLLAKQETQNWKNKFLLDSLYKEDELEDDSGAKDTEVTAEKYFISGQGDYKLNKKHSALFIFTSYEDDRFSGYTYQGSVALGYSDRLFGNSSSFFEYSVGPGYSFNETEAGISDEAAMVRLALAYEYKFSAHAKFNQDVSTEVSVEDDSNEKSKSESAITAKLVGGLSLKASYIITNNSEVEADKENTDTTTSVGVVYVF